MEQAEILVVEETTTQEPISEETYDEVSLEYLESLVSENNQLLQSIEANSVSTSTLLAQSNELLLHVYSAQLFFIGVCGACLVLFTLYKFLRKFF